MSNDQPNHNIVVLGEGKVGKTALILRARLDENAVIDPLNPNVNNQNAFSSSINVAKVNGASNGVLFTTWILGAGPNHGTLYDYLRNENQAISAIMLCFDLTNYRSFTQLANWIQRIKNCYEEGCPVPPIILVGTKSDLKKELKVNENQIDQFLSKNKEVVDYVTTSAKQKPSCDRAFSIAAAHAKNFHGELEQSSPQKVIPEMNNASFPNTRVGINSSDKKKVVKFEEMVSFDEEENFEYKQPVKWDISQIIAAEILVGMTVGVLVGTVVGLITLNPAAVIGAALLGFAIGAGAAAYGLFKCCKKPPVDNLIIPDSKNLQLI